MAIRILLADDHSPLRHALRLLLKGEADFNVVAEAGDGASALAMVAEHTPDILVIDVRLPDRTGTEVVREVCQRHNGTKVVALSAHCDPSLKQEMLEAGADSYVLKDEATEELPKAIRRAMRGSGKALSSARAQPGTPASKPMR